MAHGSTPVIGRAPETLAARPWRPTAGTWLDDGDWQAPWSGASSAREVALCSSRSFFLRWSPGQAAAAARTRRGRRRRTTYAPWMASCLDQHQGRPSQPIQQAKSIC